VVRQALGFAPIPSFLVDVFVDVREPFLPARFTKGDFSVPWRREVA